MRKHWNEAESEYTTAKSFLWKWFWRFCSVCMVIGVFAGVFNLFCNTQKVIQKEFYPDALLKKYEWFKDASAQLDKKLADIQVYEERIKEASTVDRTEREQRNLWLTELAGIKASYNSLAAEYNSQMSKFNWRFTNVGNLPPGAETPLPREYKPYTTK